MHDELTKIDIEKMKEELEERRLMIPRLREEVKRARELGDLSENDEYRSAKKEFNRNSSRMIYLQNMIDTAIIISTDSKADEVGLFDEVTVCYPPNENDTETVRIVTTLRNDVFSNNISKESPFGKALLGRKVGETVSVKTENGSYEVTVTEIKKGEDDPDLPIGRY
ncbi:MAG: GreA/GreB family elongation factor [Clostridia bacterium]|nr:GreA/GreB family elongation factor [Clostridia bacterium]